VDNQKRNTTWRVYSRRNKKGLVESQITEVEKVDGDGGSCDKR